MQFRDKKIRDRYEFGSEVDEFYSWKTINHNMYAIMSHIFMLNYGKQMNP